jgi:sporulation protein YlmC with PRC-barrel domain
VKEVISMTNRNYTFLAFAFALALDLAFSNVYAGDMTNQSMAPRDMPMASEGARLSSRLVGSDVKNLQGETLGEISDLVVDQGRHVAFAIVSHGGLGGFWVKGEYTVPPKKIAVPFQAFKFDPQGRHATLDITKERLASAPSFDKGILNNRDSAAEVYRYFGLQPYWGEVMGRHSRDEGTMR